MNAAAFVCNSGRGANGSPGRFMVDPSSRCLRVAIDLGQTHGTASAAAARLKAIPMRPRPRLRNPLRSALPIRALLVALALALMLPTLSFAALLLWRVAENEESRVTANAQQAAERVMAAIDRELTASLAALQALATSPSLLTGDWAAFNVQADQAKPVRHGQVAVWNRAGQ